ncbi:MAG: SMR family transporter [Candidatus Gracilibacteria bacterium]
MEIWLIYAILSIFAAGLHNFTMKVAAEKNYDVALISIFSYGISILLLSIYFIFNEIVIEKGILLMLLIFSFINGFFFLLSMFTRIESMKSIDTVVFFPLYKTFGPIIVTCISIIYFGESLTFKEILGITVGITVPLLLLTKTENKIQKNLFRGIILLIITAILTAISSAVSKEVMLREYNIYGFMLFSSFFGLFFSQIFYKHQKRNKKIYNSDGIIKFSIITGLLHIISFYLFTSALVGNLAVVFTINSFSILIPIILSIFYYKEHFSLKKGLVILLSIASVLLFI